MPLPKELNERLVNLGTDGGVHLKCKYNKILSKYLLVLVLQLLSFPYKKMIAGHYKRRIIRMTDCKIGIRYTCMMKRWGILSTAKENACVEKSNSSNNLA